MLRGMAKVAKSRARAQGWTAPSAEQCHHGAVVAAANAAHLVRAASCLRRSGMLGPALSLLVTASEEAVKALALEAAWSTRQGADVHPGMADAVLALVSGRDHRRRHAVAATWFPPMPAAEARQPQIESPFGDHAEGSVGLLLLLMLVAFVVGGAKKDGAEDFTVAAMADLLNVPPEEMSGWYAQAGRTREAGLYVDLERETWRTPRAVTEADLKQARAAVLPLVRAVTTAVRSEA
jgi:AbiV family abortive infection protein